MTNCRFPVRYIEMLKVLVVDDYVELHHLYTRMLEKGGYEAICAANGIEALSMLDEHVAAIITDVRMPRMDGLALLRELKMRSWKGPALVVSSELEKIYKQDFEETGTIWFFSKPFSIKDLLETLEKAIETVNLGR